jgi:hypothetical protein
MKPTNDIRDLIMCVSKDVIPTSWRAEYPVPGFVILTVWMNQIFTCLKYLSTYTTVLSTATTTTATTTTSTGVTETMNSRYCLSSMFAPEAYITAIRQQSAQVFEMILLVVLIITEGSMDVR